MGLVVSNERDKHVDSTVEELDSGLKVLDSATCSSECNVSADNSELECKRGGGAWRCWIRRLGVAGFAFFFIKGMLWLALGAVLWLMRPGAVE